jgi:uncharacterized 2Fe-2S/4Fe-4S cluster protein (DUF4445 family)
VVEADDVAVFVPPQEEIQRHLTTDRVAAEVQVPAGYVADGMQTVHRVSLTLTPPSLDDQTDDWSRFQTVLRLQAGVETVNVSLPLLRRLGGILRQGNWRVTATIERANGTSRLIDVSPDLTPDNAPLWGIAIDIGTTTVTVWLVDLISGKVAQQISEYNGQIARGEDVISRIIASGKDGGEEMQRLVIETVNELIETACIRQKILPHTVMKATVTGNSTMIHLLLRIPAENIRLEPFVTVVNHPPVFHAHELGLDVCPEAPVDCLPGVASYVGADITAGVLSSEITESDQTTLFIDVGTNGEIVLGSSDWLVTCACSAGPAFEGAGVLHGMRANKGAIEECWINGATYDPTYRVIGGPRPRGLCGSGLISLLAEMFLTGVVDKAGHINLTLPTSRVREGEHGPEYVVVWAEEAQDGRDIVITNVDIDNLLRAKAAIYAGFLVLAESVGIPLESVERVLIGGSFGKYINVEKAVEIGLLPDMPWDRFFFLGNTSVKGAYLALLDCHQRNRVKEIAARMTYIELSSDNTFYEAFMSALFLPHTDLSRFPSVEAMMVTGG